ncbi:Ankyrin repeat domain-containing protein 33B [Orchesella cincta]|uniref:Ankyrin repeat domain-containing protein 33B n=1 Tax=Orchesella cincta TaxID=48709 RepID=A0A1D2MYT4_ORCCI|nr:Ankyrin repeat domain-containing protein 33B [Orchesella cincta]
MQRSCGIAQMTPSRKNNKHSTRESPASTRAINGNNGSCYVQSYCQQRRDHINRNSQEREHVFNENETYHHDMVNHSRNLNQQQQQSTRCRDRKVKRNDREFIPLFVLVDACKENNERKIREICRKLLALSEEEAAPVVNFQDQAGRTALSYGCGCGNVIIIDEISKFKFADPNLPDNDGNAPLHYSAVCGHSEGIDLLLNRFHGDVDVNVRNVSGLTPLMKAALQGRTRCAKSLITAGASPFLRDHIRGLTAAEWARLCGKHMFAEIVNRSAANTANQNQGTQNDNASSLVYSRMLPDINIVNEERTRTTTEELPYYHMYARSTVSGAKWLKNKIKKALGASVRSGEDKSYIYNNPVVRSLADRRPTMLGRNYTPLSNLGLGGATICASSLLLPSIQPLVEQAPKPNRKLPIPVVQITPVRR